MDNYRPHMRSKVRSKKIRNAARDSPCTLRISSLVPGYACSAPDTNVLCHMNGTTKGMSSKVSDIDAGFACSNCHAILDNVDKERGEYLHRKFAALVENRMRQSVSETLAILLDEGIIVIPDGALI
jgi:hypothetical protein